jgi:putative restriction endonuclease
MSRRAHIFPTDGTWFGFLSSTGPHQDVNFWTPKPWGGRFGILDPGDVLLFRLKAPLNVIAGGGVFARYVQMPLSAAWDAFGIGNGVASVDAMRASIGRLRRESGSVESDYPIGCIILTDPFFWPRERWVPVPADYPQNAVRGRGYDLATGTGRELWTGLVDSYVGAGRSGGLRERIANPLPGGFGDPIPRRPRIGQRSFRAILMEAYGRQCAVTGERALPTLEAAHIQPFGMSEVHDLRNGLLLRSDVHRLYDAGYLTITREYEVEASDRIRTVFGGGEGYIALNGRRISLPVDPSLHPDPELLHWHATTRFLR